ncbi:MAG TPA: hypothetical protein VLE69_01155 [Candidatus Saccharimonadales bacterium]|nr:hypothetical protein [Candidatus Saccharimonadales bacterium]
MTHESASPQPTVPTESVSATMIETQLHQQTIDINDDNLAAPLQPGVELKLTPGIEMPDLNNVSLMAEVELSPGIENGTPRVAIFKNKSPDAIYGETLISIVQVNKFTNEKEILSGILNRKDTNPDLLTPEGGVKFGRKLFEDLGVSRSTDTWRRTVSGEHLTVTPNQTGFGANIEDSSTNGSTLHAERKLNHVSAEAYETEKTGEVAMANIATVEEVSESGKPESTEVQKNEELADIQAKLGEVLAGLSKEEVVSLWRYAADKVSSVKARNRGDSKIAEARLNDSMMRERELTERVKERKDAYYQLMYRQSELLGTLEQ